MYIMKMRKVFAFIALSAMCLVSCDPEKNDKPTPEPEKKSSECKLLSIAAVTADAEVEGVLYTDNAEDLIVEFNYRAEWLDGMKTATLKVVPSPKAIVSLEEGKTYNLIDGEEVRFTITSEDGEHTTSWRIVSRQAKATVTCELADEMLPGDFKIESVSVAGASVAFCGVDKIATINGEVFDFNASKVGDLSMEGVPEGAKMLNMNNDVNGVVVASFGFDKDGNPTTVNDDINYGYVYCWKDGYDKAPTLVYTNANNEPSNRGNSFGYMNCGGDVNGDFLLCAIFGGRSAAQSHHVWEFHNGDFSTSTWHHFATDYAGNDGNYGAIISPASGNVNGTFFIGDSMGDNKGYHVYTRQGTANTGEDVALTGTTMTTVPGVQSAGIPDGNAQYGNYSCGNIKAFSFNGTPYVIAATTAWPEVYITIQTNDPSDEENHYLLQTQYFAAAEQVPSAAYVYDAANDKGQVLLLGGNLVIARYEISREFI